MFDLSSLDKNFLTVRLGSMLEKRAKVSDRYKQLNREEEMQFELLMSRLSPDDDKTWDAYQTAVFEREAQELYFAYMYGLRDGIKLNNLLDEFNQPDKEEQA